MAKGDYEPGEVAYVPLSPALERAQINKLDAEARLIEAQIRKESSIATQHEFAADDAKRLHDTIVATNENNRVYDYIGVIDTRATEACLQNLSRWKRQSKEPVTLRISSPGGSVIDGLVLYDFIGGMKAAGISVRVVVLGVAASMAGVLLQSASDGMRVVAPNARFLVHEVSGGSIGKLSDMEDETKLYKSLNEQLYDLLARRSKLNRKEIELKAKRKDWWLDAQGVLDAGFCDEIGYE